MKSSELYGSIRSPAQLERAMDRLLEGWCERRCLAGLRLVLPAWPPCSALTDAWGELLTAVKQTELLEDGALSDDEHELLRDVRRYVERMVYDR
jgi:hypothetical protein